MHPQRRLIRVTVLILTLTLWLTSLPAAAQIGRWSDATYTFANSRCTYPDGAVTTWPTPDAYGLSGYPVSYDGSRTMSGTSTITATMRWVDDDGNPAPNPPDKAYLLVSSEASWKVTCSTGSVTVSDANADNGLGHAEQLVENAPNSKRKVSSGDRLIQVDGSTGMIIVTRTLNVRATATPDDPEGAGHFWMSLSFSVREDTRRIRVTAYRVDKDDPTNTSISSLDEPNVVYGGSEPSTADDLILVAEPDVPGMTYSWSGMGRSATGRVWNFGPVPPNAGIYRFTCTATDSEGNLVGSMDIEVGIRTDDEILVGWINPTEVPLSESGVVAWLLDLFPLAGPPVPDRFLAGSVMGRLTENYIYNMAGQIGQDLSALVDRQYLLNWMFKFAGNPDPTTVIPGGNFRTLNDEHINYPKIAGFVSASTQYKLFNHLQIRYRLAAGGGFNGSPIVLHRMFSNTAIGMTIDPIAGLEISGQAGPNEGLLTIASDRVSLINDGSPDGLGIKAMNTLMAKDVANPLFWENIGSQIRFLANGSTIADVTVQNYPTYYLYRNGRRVDVYVQADNPSDHFYSDPYPFGLIPTYGVGGILPGGREGEAGSPSDSSRIPPYIVP